MWLLVCRDINFVATIEIGGLIDNTIASSLYTNNVN
jgi:hypothetical protein